MNEKTDRTRGLYNKYIVRRADGREDPSAEYFVLRLDRGNPASIAAIVAYARAIASTHPQLSADLLTRYGTVAVVERLDRGKPPPNWMWRGECHDDDEREQQAQIRAWEHYESRHDLPGMDIIRGALEAVYRAAGDLSLLTRAAAWAWYWRRVAVSLAMEASGIEAYKSVWPDCLAWPDKTVAHHEAAMRLLGMPEVRHVR